MSSNKTVTLWWKPGCATNTKQIRLLEQAGFAVDVRDLLTEPWTPERLAPFFAGKPVAEWFNPAAPAVKSGEVVPAAFAAGAALARLVAQPLLIRRPLLQVGEAVKSGFDTAWLAAQGVALKIEGAAPEGCSHAEPAAAHCPPPAKSLSPS